MNVFRLKQQVTPAGRSRSSIPLRYLFLPAMVVVGGLADSAQAIGFFPLTTVVDCSSSGAVVTGCFTLDEGTGIVSYSVRIEVAGVLSTVTGATVYAGEGTTCQLSQAPDGVATLCTSEKGAADEPRSCPNPLRGSYTLSGPRQTEMLSGTHTLVVKTGGGDLWMPLDKGPPGSCFIARTLPGCTSELRAVPEVSGCLILDYNTGVVKYDIEIDPFDDSTDATANVYTGSDTESCTPGPEVLDEPLCSPAMPSTQDWCYNPLLGSYTLEDIDDRDDMIAGLHHIIVTWPEGSSRQGREIWISMFSGRVIPTVTEWGLIVMALLLVAGATCVFARRRLRQA